MGTGLITVVRDLLYSLPDRHATADVCIVGAGAAGIVLALELADAGKRVLLLEGGGATLEDEAQEPYRSTVEGRAHRGIHEGRFRTYGGTTTKWGGQILELDDLAFQGRTWVCDSGWPFSKNTLTPFYQRALELEGVNESIQEDQAVWNRLQGAAPHLPGVTSYLSRWCPEPNFAHLHRKKLSENPLIQVWLHANAVELLSEAQRATGVRVRTQTGRKALFTASSYVFSMGAIESARFFLQPRAGALSWNVSGLLGKHFQDHIDCDVASVIAHSSTALHTLFDSIFLSGYKYQPKMALTYESQQAAHVLGASAELSFAGHDVEALAEVRTTARSMVRGQWNKVSRKNIGPFVGNLPSLLRQGYRYIRAHRGYQPASATISLRVHCEQEPCSASSITLSDSRDSLGMFRTKLDWRISSLELRTIRAMTSAAQMALSGIAKVVPVAGFDEDASLAALCEDSFHHMGGMRMHASPSHGVVDPDLKLHGMENIWICSSAVFPTSGSSNPTHTLLALAVRLARRLAVE